MSSTSPAFIETDLLSVELTPAQFAHISRVVYQESGINLQCGKEGLVKARLMKRLRYLGMKSFERYLEHLEDNTQELTTMIDALTTNKTSFFRECQHFEYLRSHILHRLQRGPFRLWSAGCSSGEEPYSLAILLREEMPQVDSWDCRILATDISRRILAKAREATYDEDAVAEVPPALLQQHFIRLRTRPETYRVNDNVRALVTFGHLNLMEPWPMKGPFDVIFCRNVMIYFDKATQQALVHRFWELLKPGGHLFVGHSESLMTSSQEFRYAQPAVYIK